MRQATSLAGYSLQYHPVYAFEVLLRSEICRCSGRPYGDRSIRAALTGDVTVRYTALVENKIRQLLPQAGRQHVWSELPNEVLPFLLPSRFCPSDKFMRFAQREFSGDGAARVMAILDWIHRNVGYVAGVSDAQTTAEGTFVDRAGVCRDFTHLGITLSSAWGFEPKPSARMRCN